MNKLPGFLRPASLALLWGLLAAPILAANQPPIAAAGGPYTLTSAGSIVLDGAGSSDPNAGGTVTSYAWDIAGHGTYTDLSGAQPTLAWSAFPLAPGPHAISLKVTDSLGLSSTGAATLTVVDNYDFAVFDPFGGLYDWGEGPAAGLIFGADGRLYGTTHVGGDGGSGTIVACHHKLTREEVEEIGVGRWG